MITGKAPKWSRSKTHSNEPIVLLVRREEGWSADRANQSPSVITQHYSCLRRGIGVAMRFRIDDGAVQMGEMSRALVETIVNSRWTGQTSDMRAMRVMITCDQV